MATYRYLCAIHMCGALGHGSVNKLSSSTTSDSPVLGSIHNCGLRMSKWDTVSLGLIRLLITVQQHARHNFVRSIYGICGIQHMILVGVVLAVKLLHGHASWAIYVRD